MNKTYPKAIIFDLDDTILDTTLSADRLWSRAAVEFAARAGVDVSAFDQQMKASRVWFWSDPDRNQAGRLDLDQARADCVEHTLDLLSASNNEFATEIAEWFTERRITEMKPFDGVMKTLRALKDTGVHLGMISNGKGETQREKIVRFGLEPLFDCIVLEGEFGIGKPDRRVFDHVLQTLDVEPSEAWMVGDNLLWEVAAPQALGMKGVWVDWNGVGLPVDTDIVPDLIIRSISELIR